MGQPHRGAEFSVRHVAQFRVRDRLVLRVADGERNVPGLKLAVR